MASIVILAYDRDSHYKGHRNALNARLSTANVHPTSSASPGRFPRHVASPNWCPDVRKSAGYTYGLTGHKLVRISLD